MGQPEDEFAVDTLDKPRRAIRYTGLSSTVAADRHAIFFLPMEVRVHF